MDSRIFAEMSGNLVINLVLATPEFAQEVGFLDLEPFYSANANTHVEKGQVLENNIFVDTQVRFNLFANAARVTRNNKLAESDLYVTPDRYDNYTQEEKDAWKTYRQQLRDIETLPGWPFEVVFPLSPVEQARFDKFAEEERARLANQ